MVIKAILLSYDDVNMALYFHSSISALRNHSFSEEKIFIMKTCPCNEYPLKPHFYIGVYPQSMFWANILKLLDFFQWNFQFLMLRKFSVYCMDKFS